MKQKVLTACPRNCYSTCSFYAETEDNRLTAIYPDPANRAVPEGPCIKGLSYIERAGSSSRITTPLLKDKNGGYREISMEEALDIIAQKLKYFRDNNSPHSVLYYTGSGMSGLTNTIGYNFFSLYGGATTTYGNYCWPAGLEAVRATLGEVKHNVPWDIENAGVIVLWGKNPAETNIQEIAFISKAASRGATIVSVDPRRTPTADKADIHLSVKPGTDAALALAVCRIIIERNRHNPQFIDSFVSGFDDFKKSLIIESSDAARITGLSEDQIEEFALMVSDGRPLTIIPGYGVQRYTNGGQTIRAILAINIITGNLGKPGSSFNYANLQGYVFDRYKEPLSYYPEIDASPLFRRSVSIARLGEEMIAQANPTLKMAFIERGNPLTQACDTNLVETAFRNLEFIVAVDQFMNDTTSIADLILPAKNMFEQQDIISSYWSPYIFYRPAILNPPEGVMPETEIFYHLAKRLKLDFKSTDIPEPGTENTDRWLEERIRGYSEITVQMLKEGPVIAPGLQEIAFSDHEFSTPGGKINLRSDELSERWGVDPLPSYSDPFSKITGSGDYIFLTPNNRNRIHSQFGNLEIIKENDHEPLIEISASDAAKMEISDGDMIRIFNEKGEVSAKANVNFRIIEGCLSLPNGWWRMEGGGGNQLTQGSETDMGYGTAFLNCRVNMEKINTR
jgi:anaerobic selenocysteine-containing dehydrogenase